MNWGTKLALSLGIFMVAIASAGVYMVTQNNDSLEEGDYYEKGLNYDETYRRKQNVLNDTMTPTLQLKGDSLIIHFGRNDNQGELLLKRPSDDSLDVRFPFQIEGKRFSMSLETLERGAWNFSISWKSNGQDYLFQEALNLI